MQCRAPRLNKCVVKGVAGAESVTHRDPFATVACCLSFLPHVVSMLPYSGRNFSADFVFEGPNILVKSSEDDVDSFRVSHSSRSSQSDASLRVSLDSPGFSQLLDFVI